ncbi:MAG TPA: peptidylprolyl isomerase [candidate division Zixibacteria bacterium]|nr:peptidylprolyl isomerase [candidate division Zixibacteria bacterium]
MKKLLALLVISSLATGALLLMASFSGPMIGRGTPAVTLTAGQTVKEGSLVSIEYVLRDETGQVIESNVGKEPLTYVHGAGQIVPGLEKGLAGLGRGARKTVTVKPEDGYGPLNPDLVQEMPKEKFPAGSLDPGTVLMMQTPQGPIPIRVREVKEKTVVVDLNNPLAGKTLTFDVTIKDIQEASAP